jgi:hypothetical protein
MLVDNAQLVLAAVVAAPAAANLPLCRSGRTETAIDNGRNAIAVKSIPGRLPSNMPMRRVASTNDRANGRTIALLLMRPYCRRLMLSIDCGSSSSGGGDSSTAAGGRGKKMGSQLDIVAIGCENCGVGV